MTALYEEIDFLRDHIKEQDVTINRLVTVCENLLETLSKTRGEIGELKDSENTACSVSLEITNTNGIKSAYEFKYLAFNTYMTYTYPDKILGIIVTPLK